MFAVTQVVIQFQILGNTNLHLFTLIAKFCVLFIIRSHKHSITLR